MYGGFTMKIMFVVFFVWFYFFGSVKINNSEARGLNRIIMSLVGSGIFTLILGLPVCGILYLISH